MSRVYKCQNCNKDIIEGTKGIIHSQIVEGRVFCNNKCMRIWWLGKKA